MTTQETKEKAAEKKMSNPFVRLVLLDLEQERRNLLAPVGLLRILEPLGQEFSFEVFNSAGEKVGFGRADYIPGKQVTVRQIKTHTEHRRKYYATSVVLELSRLFDHLPIVPVDERRGGWDFWAALRERQDTGDLVKEQISTTTADQLLREASHD